MDKTPKAQVINKAKIEIKLKHFCTAKQTSFRLKKQPIKQEKIFEYYASDKGLQTRT